jgi:hypothetical protein
MLKHLRCQRATSRAFDDKSIFVPQCCPDRIGGWHLDHAHPEFAMRTCWVARRRSANRATLKA